MKTGSLFTGIAGFDLGFERVGIDTAWQAEQDKNCLKLLEQKFPKTKRYTDVRKITRDTQTVDIITGGFPCQDVSVAGLRAGLAGERSGLWFEFHRILTEHLPRWVIIENVPGLLSSNQGRDFAVILRGLVECGYGVAWRILDAQYFGVAQRRRRVFIVGSLGNGRAAKVLFESEGLSGNTPPSRETGQNVAGTIKGGSGQRGWSDPSDGNGGRMIEIAPSIVSNGDAHSGFRDEHGLIAKTLTHGLSSGYRINPDENLIAYNIQHNDGGSHKRKDRPNGGLYVNKTDTSLTVGSTDMTAIAYGLNSRNNILDAESQTLVPVVANGINNSGLRGRRPGSAATTVYQQGVRRLTPTECERLQGFPDGWTEGFSDSVRYRMLGNAVAVPVAEWIARRIIRLGE